MKAFLFVIFAACCTQLAATNHPRIMSGKPSSWMGSYLPPFGSWFTSPDGGMNYKKVGLLFAGMSICGIGAWWLYTKYWRFPKGKRPEQVNPSRADAREKDTEKYGNYYEASQELPARTYLDFPEYDEKSCGEFWGFPLKNQDIVESFLSMPYRCGFIQTIGARPSMEDRSVFLVAKDARYAFWGVYDGQGGVECAEYLEAHLHRAFNQRYASSQKGSSGGNPNIREALISSFLQIDRSITKKPFKDHAGSFAIVAVVKDKTLYIANCGDSRAVLCENGKAIALSHDHRPIPNGPEHVRIQKKANALREADPVILYGVWRVSRLLAVSRAFGYGAHKSLSHYVIESLQNTPMAIKLGD